jgi:hypothetical protein
MVVDFAAPSWALLVLVAGRAAAAGPADEVSRAIKGRKATAWPAAPRSGALEVVKKILTAVDVEWPAIERRCA